MERDASSVGWLAVGSLHIFRFATKASAMTAPFRAGTFAGTDGVASTFVEITKCYTLLAPCTTATCCATAPPNSTAMSVHLKRDAARIWLLGRYPVTFTKTPAIGRDDSWGQSASLSRGMNASASRCALLTSKPTMVSNACG